jgi:hypothetical protein
MTPSPNFISASTPTFSSHQKRSQPKSPNRVSQNPRGVNQFFSAKKTYNNSSPVHRNHFTMMAAVASMHTNDGDTNFYSPLADKADTEADITQDTNTDGTENQKNDELMADTHESQEDTEKTRHEEETMEAAHKTAPTGTAKATDCGEIIAKDASSDSNSTEPGIVHAVLPTRGIIRTQLP